MKKNENPGRAEKKRPDCQRKQFQKKETVIQRGSREDWFLLPEVWAQEERRAKCREKLANGIKEKKEEIVTLARQRKRAIAKWKNKRLPCR